MVCLLSEFSVCACRAGDESVYLPNQKCDNSWNGLSVGLRS